MSEPSKKSNTELKVIIGHCPKMVGTNPEGRKKGEGKETAHYKKPESNVTETEEFRKSMIPKTHYQIREWGVNKRGA